LPGDYDGSGVVDQGDYTLWKVNFGSAMSLAADGNGNQVVDAADYAIWRDNLGRDWLSLAAGSGLGAAIPEPATAGLLLLTAAWLICLRSRGRPDRASRGFD
jgi:hypothetical protein